MVHTSMHLTRSNSDYPNGNDGTRTSSIVYLNFLSLLNYLPRLRGGRVRTGMGGMSITLAIGLEGTHINDFFEGGSLGRLWKMSGDDDEVDKVSVCRSIMVHTNSSY